MKKGKNVSFQNFIRTLMVFLICVGMFLEPMSVFASSNTNTYTYNIILPQDYKESKYGSVSYTCGPDKEKHYVDKSTPITYCGDGYNSFTVYVRPYSKGVTFVDGSGKYLSSNVSKDGTWYTTINGRNGSNKIEVRIANVPDLYKKTPVWEWKNQNEAVATFTNGQGVVVKMEANVNMTASYTNGTLSRKSTASVYFMGEKYYDTMSDTPYIQFSEDGKSAKLIKKDLSGHIETLSESADIKSKIVKRASYSEMGRTQYIATFIYNGKYYEDYKTVEDIPKLQNTTVSLKEGSKVFATGQLTHGDMLYNLELNRFGYNRAVFVNSAGVEVQGTLYWENGSLIPDAGQQNVTWYFSPTESGYKTIKGNITINVLENENEKDVTDVCIQISETGKAKLYGHTSNGWIGLWTLPTTVQYLQGNTDSTYKLKYSATATYKGKVYRASRIVVKDLHR